MGFWATTILAHQIFWSEGLIALLAAELLERQKASADALALLEFAAAGNPILWPTRHARRLLSERRNERSRSARG